MLSKSVAVLFTLISFSALAGNLSTANTPQAIKNAINAQNAKVEQAVDIFVGGDPNTAAGILATVYNQQNLVAQFQGFPTVTTFPDLLNVFGAIIAQGGTDLDINPTPPTINVLSIKHKQGNKYEILVEEIGTNVITFGTQPVPGQFYVIWKFEAKKQGNSFNYGVPTVIRDTFSFTVPLAAPTH